MTIIKRKSKKKNFSIIDNGGILDRSLSWKATGLWTWLMSKPEDWEVNLENLCSSKLDGKDSVLSALSELEDTGYLVYQRWRNPNGQFESAYTVFESPEQLNEWKEEADPIEVASIARVSKTKGRKRTTTAEKPQWSNHGGKTTVEEPQWKNRNGLTTVENPQQLNIDIQSTEVQRIELLSTEVVKPLPTAEKPVAGDAVECEVVEPFEDSSFVEKKQLTASQELALVTKIEYSGGEYVKPEQIDLATLKEIEQVANSIKKRPWRINAAQFKPEMLKAVYRANPGWYSIEGTAVPNEKKIKDRLSRLEQQLKQLNESGVKAYEELTGYWRLASSLDNPMAQMSPQEVSRLSKAQEIYANIADL
jgi:hypothetical protein